MLSPAARRPGGQVAAAPERFPPNAYCRASIPPPDVKNEGNDTPAPAAEPEPDTAPAPVTTAKTAPKTTQNAVPLPNTPITRQPLKPIQPVPVGA